MEQKYRQALTDKKGRSNQHGCRLVDGKSLLNVDGRMVIDRKPSVTPARQFLPVARPHARSLQQLANP
jgi:hypothetical protein